MRSATEAQPETATFYAWINSAPTCVPSSETVRISGGQRQKDANSGAILALDHLQVSFNMGILRSSDPEVIRVLRDMISKGANYTEDYELYLRKIMKPEDLAKRSGAQAVKLKSENEKLTEQASKQAKEIEELKAKLAKRGSASQPAA